MAKICCGGFNLGNGLELNGKTLSASGGAFIANAEIIAEEVEEAEVFNFVSCDKTVSELVEAYVSGETVIMKMFIHGDTGVSCYASVLASTAINDEYDEKKIVCIPFASVLKLLSRGAESTLCIVGENDGGEDSWSIKTV